MNMTNEFGLFPDLINKSLLHIYSLGGAGLTDWFYRADLSSRVRPHRRTTLPEDRNSQVQALAQLA